jgi:hypothetical protein
VFTTTVEHEGVTVVVGRATPLTILMRAVYKRALIQQYPDVEKWMAEIEACPDEEARTAYVEAMRSDERDILNAVSGFIHFASLILSAKGMPFTWPRAGEIPVNERVQEMFGYYLTDMSGLWNKISAALSDLSVNIAPPEEQAIPPGTEEEVDPNDSPLTDNGLTEYDGMPVELFSGERSS